MQLQCTLRASGVNLETGGLQLDDQQVKIHFLIFHHQNL